jgi:hypothetical protein
MMHQTFKISEPLEFDAIISLASHVRIPRIDKIIDLWEAAVEESQDTDDIDRMSLFGLRRYVDYMTHYPIPANKFYLSCAPNGAIGLTAYFDTCKLVMRFDRAETITYIKWGDYRERFRSDGH